MQFVKFLNHVRPILAYLLVGLSLAAAGTASATLPVGSSPFTSAQLAAQASSYGSNASTLSSTGTELVPLYGTQSIIGMEITVPQANVIVASTFWSRMAAKMTFTGAASRMVGGCAAGLIMGGVQSRNQTTVAMKSARVISGCTAGLIGGAASEFVWAAVLAMTAPAWSSVAAASASIAAGVFVMGAVSQSLNYAADKLWFEKSSAERKLTVVNGAFQAPRSNQTIQEEEYFTTGWSVNPNRYLKGYNTQGYEVVDFDDCVKYQRLTTPRTVEQAIAWCEVNTGIKFEGQDSVGGASIRMNCAPTSAGYVCVS